MFKNHDYKHWLAYFACALIVGGCFVVAPMHDNATTILALAAPLFLYAGVNLPQGGFFSGASADAAKKAGAALILLLGLGGLIGGGAAVEACNASSQQIDTTIQDGAKVGVCITVALLSGADPLSCASATETLVVDVINDIEAQPADAGSPPITAAQKSHIENVRVDMVARLAKKAAGK